MYYETNEYIMDIQICFQRELNSQNINSIWIHDIPINLVISPINKSYGKH